MPINMDAFPLRVFRQSRELMWDPTEIDYSQDKKDWEKLGESERDLLIRMSLGFLIGERGVTHDLAPLQIALRREKGRMEEEMYITTQLFEEAKHVEFFQLWMNEVLPGVIGRDIPFPPVYGTLFAFDLPSVLGAVIEDKSPRAQLRATTLYHQVVEGMLGEAGYHIFYDAFEGAGLMPGLVKGVHHVQRDEVRHIAFGTYLAQRIIHEHPELERDFEQAMEEFSPHGFEFPTQIFKDYPKDKVPFGLDPDRYHKLMRQLYESRLANVKKGQLVEA